MPKRFVLEGEWTGYTSSQQRVVHREIIPEYRAKRLEKIHKIPFSDGTSLVLYVRAAKPRERIASLLGYSSLIRDTEHAAAITARESAIVPPSAREV